MPAVRMASELAWADSRNVVSRIRRLFHAVLVRMRLPKHTGCWRVSRNSNAVYPVYDNSSSRVPLPGQLHLGGGWRRPLDSLDVQLRCRQRRKAMFLRTTE
jgi:hypothetical protein